MLHPPRPGRSLGAALLCASVVAIFAPPAHAAIPQAGAKFVNHDHATPGDGRHVELTVSSDARRVRQLVLHDERCEATVLTSNVAISAQGVIDSAKPFTSRGRSGTWRLQARFTDPHHLEGSFELDTESCDGPVRTFAAHAAGHHPGGHGHHHGHLYGTPFGEYPDLSRATPRRLAQARRLWRASVRESRGRFATYARARRLGFRSSGVTFRRPQFFHLRHAGYAATPGSFDAEHPESLVYWRPMQGRPVLIAYMYRLPYGRRPRFAAPLLGWHIHGQVSAHTTQMTHVWLTRDLRSALANCMPVNALEKAIPRYRYAPSGRPVTPESQPCPDTQED